MSSRATAGWSEVRAEELLRKRRDRSIAIVMHVKDRQIDPLLKGVPGGPEASKRIRKAVLDQFNDFCDMAVDIASSGEAKNFWFNDELWNRRLDEIRGAMRETLEAFEDGMEEEGDGDSG